MRTLTKWQARVEPTRDAQLHREAQAEPETQGPKTLAVLRLPTGQLFYRGITKPKDCTPPIGCFYWTRNRECQHTASGCYFSHDTTDTVSSPCSPQHSVCRNWSYGNCHLSSEQCLHRHDYTAVFRTTSPEKFIVTGMCTTAMSCAVYD